MTDDFTRALAELQGAHAELMTCFVAGRRMDEATTDYERVMVRARAVRDDLGKRHQLLARAIDRALETITVIETQEAKAA